MNLAICAPVDPRPLAAYLDPTPGGIPTGMGGASVVALTRAALQAGWKVTLFSLDPDVREETVLSGPRLKICLCPFRARGRARDLFRMERDFLTRAIRRERPELLHAHWTYEFALAALDSGTPTLVTAHDRPLRILRWDHSPYRCVRTWMAAQVAHRTRWMTAVSGGVADHFLRYFGCRAPLPVIPNGLDDAWFEAVPPPAREAGFVFAAVLTGWGPLKNGRALLHAFRRVRESLPDARLQLFGDDHGPGEAAELWAKRRQLTDGVVFAGKMEQHELRPHLRTADVLVHPSLEESYSMVTAEAMALGIPVIASRGSGGIAETLDGGRHAVLTDATRPQSLAQAMLRLARSPESRGELASGAQAAVRSQFAIRNVLESYAHLYRALGAA